MYFIRFLCHFQFYLRILWSFLFVLCVLSVKDYGGSTLGGWRVEDITEHFNHTGLRALKRVRSFTSQRIVSMKGGNCTRTIVMANCARAESTA